MDITRMMLHVLSLINAHRSCQTTETYIANTFKNGLLRYHIISKACDETDWWLKR